MKVKIIKPTGMKTGVRIGKLSVYQPQENKDFDIDKFDMNSFFATKGQNITNYPNV